MTHVPANFVRIKTSQAIWNCLKQNLVSSIYTTDEINTLSAGTILEYLVVDNIWINYDQFKPFTMDDNYKSPLIWISIDIKIWNSFLQKLWHHNPGITFV